MLLERANLTVTVTTKIQRYHAEIEDSVQWLIKLGVVSPYKEVKPDSLPKEEEILSGGELAGVPVHKKSSLLP